MKTNDLEGQLRSEGFTHTYVWQDGPGVHYPDHTHATVTAHIILEGEMTVTSQGKTETYKTGDRFDVPANTVHSARMGPQGCRYLIGER
jgi:mannose-6-phosphate isomerase-like protein (cupin superfamily)